MIAAMQEFELHWIDAFKAAQTGRIKGLNGQIATAKLPSTAPPRPAAVYVALRQ